MTNRKFTGEVPIPQQGRRRLVAAVDADAIYRAGLSWLIGRAPDLTWVGHAGTTRGALRLAAHARADVVLVDSRLDPQGELTRILSSGEHGLTVLLVVEDGDHDPEFVARMMEAGAQGAIPRAAEAGQLLMGIRRTLPGRRYLDPVLAGLSTDCPVTPAPRARRPAAANSALAVALSQREYQVLDLLAEGLENAAIADIFGVSVETVRTHVKNILRKLRARDRTHAVSIGFRHGLLTLGGEPGAAGDRMRQAVAGAAR
ncbi:response regulator transcription factor [Amycolatopsis rhizosphaerae]|uniref:Response regulator transcription factor n=1 Tax=Amycolatopsis rhizosphaerae TaxID=2053003 RepID=A0A558AFM4_9PSEU|nr:response regulator transcription factor [Amycolatopsis rhizosphaerae]TVT23062.1 response regulator transcription factor [Amycolatopsis rhizosphaerae]